MSVHDRETALRRPVFDLTGCFEGDPAVPGRLDALIFDRRLPSELFAEPNTSPPSSVAPSSYMQGPASSLISGMAEPATKDTLVLRGLSRSATLSAQSGARPQARAGRSDETTAPVSNSQPRMLGLPQAGSIIDKYRLEELLGTGGFAAIFRATHLLLQIPVAIKMLLPHIVARNPGMADMLCEEGRFIALLNHPNIVRIYDVTSSKEITYIVMEYVQGSSLDKKIRKLGRFPQEEVLKIAIQLCSGLQAALAKGLIHRDIKPANILMTQEGLVKVVDLGLAQPLAHSDIPASPGLDPNSIVGTPAYMAPEQAFAPSELDYRSDMYSLGATLYHALVGEAPFSASDPMQLLYLHQSKDPVPPSQIHPEISEELSEMVLWMMAKKKVDRPPSYDDMRQILERMLEKSSKSSDSIKSSSTFLQRLTGFFSR